ncbi:MAG TPA: c-type cytochrome [Burkholderiales bacterium]|nr:c-type cytochrome [Burkholderiales bacterium]
MSADDQHSSFIKTPQQLIVVVLLAFVVPVIGITLLVQLVTSMPTADPNALTPESVAARLQPVGHVEFGAAGGAAAAGARSGEEIVKTVCATCHQAGVAGAPKIGDKAAWAPRIKQGYQALVQSALKGKGAMPPKGGNPSLTDEEIERAVAYLADQAGANFKAPAPKPAAQAAAPAAQAAAAPQPPATAQASAGAPSTAEGKKVFDTTCMACHATGVAGAPKLGDKAAWAPRLQQGEDALVQSALKGKNAMPPKGGNLSLTDAQVRAAVEYMVSQAK